MLLAADVAPMVEELKTLFQRAGTQGEIEIDDHHAVPVGARENATEIVASYDIVVDGTGANPIEDINNVRRLQLVLKEGRVVSDKRP